MKRTAIRRPTWQEIQARGPQCEVRGCKRQPEDDVPRCARHAPAYLFELSKLGELGPPARLRDDPTIKGYGQDAPVHPRSAGQVKAAQRKYKQSAWRRQCLKVRPAVCVAAELGGCAGQLECDHIFPRSAGGPYVVENGAFLCSEHHRQKTDSELQYRRHWLGADQIAWLESVKWFVWEADGSVSGRGWRHAMPLS